MLSILPFTFSTCASVRTILVVPQVEASGRETVTRVLFAFSQERMIFILLLLCSASQKPLLEDSFQCAVSVSKLPNKIH